MPAVTREGSVESDGKTKIVCPRDLPTEVPGQKESSGVNQATENARILVVDDDDAVRSQIRWALAPNYEVFVAADRPSALDILRRERPPLVTLDLGLPPSPGDTTEGFMALADTLRVDPFLKVI